MPPNYFLNLPTLQNNQNFMRGAFIILVYNSNAMSHDRTQYGVGSACLGVCVCVCTNVPFFKPFMTKVLALIHFIPRCLCHYRFMIFAYNICCELNIEIYTNNPDSFQSSEITLAGIVRSIEMLILMELEAKTNTYIFECRATYSSPTYDIHQKHLR